MTQAERFDQSRCELMWGLVISLPTWLYWDSRVIHLLHWIPNLSQQLRGGYCCNIGYPSNQFHKLRPRQNGHQFADDIFNCIVVNETFCISNDIPLKCVPWDLINNVIIGSDNGLVSRRHYLNQLEIVDQWSTRIPRQIGEGSKWQWVDCN